MGKGGVSPDYFLYRMQWHEAQLYMDGLAMRDRTAWTTTRWLGWLTARLLGSKADDPSSLLPFPWEQEPDDPIDEAELQSLLSQCSTYNHQHAPASPDHQPTTTQHPQ